MHENLTRRQLAGGLTMGVAGIGASARAQGQKPGTSLHQEVDFKASPSRIYALLLDAKEFAALSQSTAEIEAKAGGHFKLFGGLIEGRNVELVPGHMIVQAWRPASWPAGVYSIARFELVAKGSGTRLILDHTGFTEDHWEHFQTGWPERYWEPMHKYLKE